MVSQRLDDKVVLIAGGAKNLGGLLSRELAQLGARAIAVHYNSDASTEAAEETRLAVLASGAECELFQSDLTRAEHVARLFDAVKQRFGRVDIAVNTVGMVLKKPILDISEDDYDRMFAINAKSAFFFLKEAGRVLEDHGRIVTLVTSLLGAFTPFYSTYAGAKAPVEHFTRAAAKEFGGRGISVTAVGPGPMDTPFFYGQEDADAVAYHKSAAALSNHSRTGLTDIEDVVPLIRHLVTDGWWMTGQTLLTNGGYTTK